MPQEQSYGDHVNHWKLGRGLTLSKPRGGEGLIVPATTLNLKNFPNMQENALKL